MWPTAIITKLNLFENPRKIVSDNTGVLLLPDFLRSLELNQIPCIIINTLSKLMSFPFPDDNRLILTPLTELPVFLTNKRDHVLFTHADLPLHAPVSLIKHLTPEMLCHLLDVVYAANPHLVITPHNLADLLLQTEHWRCEQEITRLQQEIDEILGTEADYNKILKLGELWGKLGARAGMAALQRMSRSDRSDGFDLSDKRSGRDVRVLRIDRYVADYILAGRLRQVFYESPTQVKTVDKIPAFLKTRNDEKLALICFDGMGVAEWELLKELLVPLNLTYRERYCFSLLPAITSISRQAIFSGSYTDVYTSSINEPKAFHAHFPERSYRHYTEKDKISPDTLLGFDLVSILYGFFDEMAHSTAFPPDFDSKVLYFETVRNYLIHSRLLETLKILLNEGFHLFFCADHGSIVAAGNGRKIDKYLQETFARRACIVEESALTEFPDLPQLAVPFVEHKKIIFAPERTMFDYAGHVGITHGGMTVDEIVVPFVEVTLEC